MRKQTLAFTCIVSCMLFSITIQGQETTTKEDKTNSIEEESSPIMYKFEPDFVNHQNKKKAEIAFTRSIIDTLDISERKRARLLRDLYKNGVSKRLEKATLVETRFVEDN